LHILPSEIAKEKSPFEPYQQNDRRSLPFIIGVASISVIVAPSSAPARPSIRPALDLAASARAMSTCSLEDNVPHLGFIRKSLMHQPGDQDVATT
jgi:hypothetical protein